MKTEVELENRLGHKKFKLLFSDKEIDQRIQTLAESINRDFSRSSPLVIIGVLKGSFIFIADLVRKLTVQTQIEFIGAASYAKTQSTGTVNITQALTASITGKNVLLVEDIIDSGTTIKALVSLLKKENPKDLKICSLFVKPNKIKDLDIEIDYVGFKIADGFIVGYGLDYDQALRELPHVIELLDVD